MNIRQAFIVFFLCLAFPLLAEHPANKDEHLVEHLTWFETFFGDEQLHQVCYPKDHRSMFIFIIVFSILTLVLGSLVLYIKSKSAKKLKEKNSIIEEQNKDLIDSMNYASRIQQAILPDPIIEKQVLANGFVFYQAKDIISGDFYWLHKCDELLFFAVIDCTGHGVPGALLTMLASNAINKAVLENEITNPAEILHAMNTDIKQALKQNMDNPIQDSMEIALVCLNTKTLELQFAGANLALTLVKNQQLEIIRGAKCSVGSVQNDKADIPVTHIVQLQAGDSFYLYSDGFADQFGGLKGKKFKYKQLEELLLKNASKSPFEQKEMIHDAFQSWKGNLDQVDDVCLIGVRSMND